MSAGWWGTYGDPEACFWDTQTSSQSSSAGGTGKTTAEMQDPNTFMAAGWDFVGQPDGPHDIWAEPEGGGYPILWWQQSPLPSLPGFSGGSGEPNNPYLISSPEELNSIGHNPRLMKCDFKLVSDLDLAGIHVYPIGDYDFAYDGVFDGNRHTISHVTTQSVDYPALFSVLTSDAEVKDLGVVDVNIAGSSAVGGLAGSNSGTVTRCYSTGTVNGLWSVGGLVGENSGTVTHCYSTGVVSGTSDIGGLLGWNYDGALTDCYSTGAVSGSEAVGGLAGSNGGTMSACYSTGPVTGSGSYIGGLVGCPWVSAVVGRTSRKIDGNVSNCIWDAQSSGQATSAGGTGKTTAELQTASTFLEAGWDFIFETANGTEDIWWILEGQDYPRLWWEAEEP
jgi:hypothetical protein